MIKAGIQLGLVKLFDNIRNYHNPIFLKNLSLNQSLYKWEDYFFRIDEDNLINWISIKIPNKYDLSYEGIIKIGIDFMTVIKFYDLEYDGEELIFKIVGVNGLSFSFDNCSIEQPGFKQKKITSIIVYDICMDKNNHLLGLDKITLDNLKEYLND